MTRNNELESIYSKQGKGGYDGVQVGEDVRRRLKRLNLNAAFSFSAPESNHTFFPRCSSSIRRSGNHRTMAPLPDEIVLVPSILDTDLYKV